LEVLSEFLEFLFFTDFAKHAHPASSEQMKAPSTFVAGHSFHFPTGTNGLFKLGIQFSCEVRQLRALEFPGG
jgi:hypothetical protein